MKIIIKESICNIFAECHLLDVSGLVPAVYATENVLGDVVGHEEQAAPGHLASQSRKQAAKQTQGSLSFNQVLQQCREY